MNAEVTMLTGATAGKRMVLSGGEITVGRSTDTDFQLNPFQDLRVSGHHAAFVLHGQGWAIRDLGSRNGTFLNGRRISEPSSLRDGDQIQFGENGPVAVFRLLHPAEGLPPLPPAVHPNTLSEADFTACYATAPGGDEPPSPQGVPQPAPTLAPQAVGAGSPRARESWRGPTLVVGLSVALLATGLLALHSRREGERYRAQLMTMQERIDSILDASAASADALQGRIQGLHDALVDSRERLERVRREMEAAQRGGSADEVAALRVQVQEAQAALVRQQLAANLDFDAIEAANGLAVVKVYVDFGGEVITATAFAVREDATLLTNRHVVLGPGGDRTPQRVAAQFADSRQVWPARVVATSDVDDLAVLKVDNIVGGVPTILGFNTRPDTVQAGQGVAVIGFPLGGADLAAGEGSGTVARTTLTAGVVSAIREGRMEVNGYGVEGSSGSPIFDGDGKLVGVLYGGRVVDGERTLFAVSVDRVAAFLRKVP